MGRGGARGGAVVGGGKRKRDDDNDDDNNDESDAGYHKHGVDDVEIAEGYDSDQAGVEDDSGEDCDDDEEGGGFDSQEGFPAVGSGERGDAADSKKKGKSG